jgi:TusA-related sulfurtransferase
LPHLAKQGASVNILMEIFLKERMRDMEANHVLDCKGLQCPVPLIQAKRAVERLSVNEILELHTTDPGSLQDIPMWARANGHTIVKQQTDGSTYLFWIKKGRRED